MAPPNFHLGRRTNKPFLNTACASALTLCGESEIPTHGSLKDHNGFRDRPDRVNHPFERIYDLEQMFDLIDLFG